VLYLVLVALLSVGVATAVAGAVLLRWLLDPVLGDHMPLATLYGAGTMGYVGGGFGRAGLHSVLEPAAWGIPVAFGPRWRNSRDACLLLTAKAAVSLPADPTAAERALAQEWERWIREPEVRQAEGRRAREVIEQGVGASERSAAMLTAIISAPRPRRSPTEVPATPQ
jgi:3-deoxy-D-manno-octulosonic-acid transferase